MFQITGTNSDRNIKTLLQFVGVNNVNGSYKNNSYESFGINS